MPVNTDPDAPAPARTSGLGTVVAITAAQGGGGASCLVLLLARALSARGAQVAIIDGDPAGTLGMLLGQELLPGLRWADLPSQESAFRPQRLAQALPTWLGMRILTGDYRGGPRHSEQLLPAAAALASLNDLVLLDLPRGTAPPPGCQVLLLSSLDLRSALAARVLCERIKTVADRVQLVVKNVGEDVDAASLQRLTGIEVLGTMAWDRSIGQRVARGDDITRTRGAGRRSARHLAAALLQLLALPVPRTATCRHALTAPPAPPLSAKPAALSPKQLPTFSARQINARQGQKVAS